MLYFAIRVRQARVRRTAFRQNRVARSLQIAPAISAAKSRSNRGNVPQKFHRFQFSQRDPEFPACRLRRGGGRAANARLIRPTVNSAMFAKPLVPGCRRSQVLSIFRAAQGAPQSATSIFDRAAFETLRPRAL